jgi:hypothetical protein
VQVILYSSLDIDYLTNMIIQQGEYMMWFTSNFEGEEDGPELEFKEDKVETWSSIVTLGMEIVAFWGKNENREKDVFSEKVWNTIRFGTFAAELSDKLQDQSVKNKLRKLFKDTHDQLSYFDFFKFINEHGITL